MVTPETVTIFRASDMNAVRYNTVASFDEDDMLGLVFHHNNLPIRKYGIQDSKTWCLATVNIVFVFWGQLMSEDCKALCCCY